MAATAMVLGVWAVLLAPGLGIAWLMFADRPALERIGLGVALGVALAVIRATLWHATVGFDTPAVLWSVELGLAAAGLVGCFVARARRTFDRNVALSVGLATTVGVLARLVIIRGQAGPLPAYDAPAHCTLARSLMLSPGRATWLPFMDASPHYPWGVHALLAEVSTLTGVPIHGTFSILVTGGLGGASILVLAGLSRALWRKDEPAVGTAWLYALASGALGLLYGRWGGLPSEVGLLLVCGIALALAQGRRGAVMVAPLTLGLLFAHHLSALIGAVALVVPFFALWWSSPTAHRRWSVTALAATAAAVVLAVPMWWTVLDVDLAGDTAAFAIPRHMDLFALAGDGIGTFLIVFAAVPLFGGERPPARARLALLGSVTALVVGFVLCFSVAKLVTGLMGTPRAMLVPTRWAAALTYPLAILAGGGAAQAWERTSAPVLRVGALAALCSMGLYSTWKTSRPRLDPEVWSFHADLASRAQPGDVVVSLTDQARWSSYLTGLESGSIPAPPGSDPLTPRARALATLGPRLLDGAPPGIDVAGKIWVIADRRRVVVPERPDLVEVTGRGPLVLLEWRGTP